MWFYGNADNRLFIKSTTSTVKFIDFQSTERRRELHVPYPISRISHILSEHAWYTLKPYHYQLNCKSTSKAGNEENFVFISNEVSLLLNVWAIKWSFIVLTAQKYLNRRHAQMKHYLNHTTLNNVIKLKEPNLSMLLRSTKIVRGQVSLPYKLCVGPHSR